MYEVWHSPGWNEIKSEIIVNIKNLPELSIFMFAYDQSILLQQIHNATINKDVILQSHDV
jgi:hypothetical protein